MGKNETMVGVVRGPEPVAPIAAVPPVGQFVPVWEAHSPDAFTVQWEQRTYQLNLKSGIPTVAQQEWLIKGDPARAVAVPGTLITLPQYPVVSFANFKKIMEYCRSEKVSIRRAYAKMFGSELNGEQKALIASAPDVYVAPLPESGHTSPGQRQSVEEFFKSL